MNPKRLEKSFRTGPYEDLLDLSDRKLRTEDGYIFDVDSVILARANCYFHALFHGLGQYKRDILVPGINGRILEMILLHIRNGTVPLTQDDICELMVASDYLLADSIMLEVKQFAKHNISLNHCIPLYMTALKINYKDHHKDILRESYRYIQTHFEVLVSQADITDIPFESMKQFLGDRNLCVSGEHIIWFAIVKWTQGREEFSHRLCHVPDFLLSLQLADVGESLATEILCHDIVAGNNFCKDLNEMKSKAEFETNLSVLVDNYMAFSGRPPGHRRPGWIHLIARYNDQNLNHRLEVFVTYDENLDLWRRLGETDFCPEYFTSIGHSVYMSGESSNFVFDIFEKRPREINFQRPRVSCHLVNLQNVIYAVGGVAVRNGEEVMDVEFYCSETGMWITAMPMMPIASYSAVAYEDSIYVIGKSPDDLMMMAQVYDAGSDSWTMFSPPTISRDKFAFVAYHQKLYTVGGTNESERMKNVERFDFDRHDWEEIEDLPYAYYAPKAIVLNDRLVVHDGLEPGYVRKYPPVLLNETDTSWEMLDESLDMIDLAFYLFCSVEDSEAIAEVLHENRNPGTHFEKSPFGKNFDVRNGTGKL